MKKAHLIVAYYELLFNFVTSATDFGGLFVVKYAAL